MNDDFLQAKEKKYIKCFIFFRSKALLGGPVVQLGGRFGVGDVFCACLHLLQEDAFCLGVHLRRDSSAE